MTLYNIYPTGLVAKDTHILNVALNGGNLNTAIGAANGDLPDGAFAGLIDGDTLLMHYQSEDTPGGNDPSGGSVSWLLGLAKATNPTLVTPGGNIPYNDISTGTAIWTADNEPIPVGINVTIKGEVDGGNSPLTVVTQDNFPADAAALAGGDYKSCGFFAHNMKLVRFENLKFYKVINPISTLTTFEEVNCVSDLCINHDATMWIHNDVTYPLLSSNDFSIVNRSLIKDCTFVNMVVGAPGFINGSGLTMEGCTSGPYNGEWLKAWQTLSGFAGGHALEIGCGAMNFGQFLSLAGIPAAWLHNTKVKVSYASDYIVRNNLWTAEGQTAPPTGGYQEAAIVLFAFFGGAFAERNEFNTNTFTDWMDYQQKGLATVQFFDYYLGIPGLPLNKIRDCTIYGNTFQKSSLTGSGTLNFFSLGASIDDCVVADNIFDTGTYNSTRTPAGSWFPRAAIELSNCSSAVSMGNDFVNSGYPNLNDTVNVQDSCVWLNGCSYCKVKETGKFPVGQGGPINHVSDLNGVSNRIVGFPANMIEKPAGIGDVVAGYNTQAGHDHCVGYKKSP